ncbi:MAG: hypothetical protein FP816_21460 [Desulfobacteraceae bacterium]|nr:hypothetical protein [Desulfobacteraceae bacterium]MBU3947842.1 hypothetical protein [Pseudomonadota bacterium]MBU4011443.1 hypothetical protein [Pseudomonadota bacterium]
MFTIEDVDFYLLASDISVMLGMTGLSIVHSFSVGHPFVTIKSPYHSPEVAYLKHGISGLMSESDIDFFCAAIESLVVDPYLRNRMGIAALNYAKTELSRANKRFRADN